MSSIALSVVSSFIFYYFTIYNVEKAERKQTDWFLHKKLEQIKDVGYTFKTVIEEQGESLKSSNINRCLFLHNYVEDISEEGSIRFQTLNDLYYNTIIDIKKLTNQIFTRCKHINTDIFDTLIEIEECEFMTRKIEMKRVNKSGTFFMYELNMYEKLLLLIDRLPISERSTPKPQ